MSLKISLNTSLFLFISFFFFACTTGKSQFHHSKKENKEDKKEHNENLSSYRPRYDLSKEDSNGTGTTKDGPKQDKNGAIPQIAVTPTNDITRILNQKLDSLEIKNERIKLAEGYRILVYSGSNSEEAKKIKEIVKSVVPQDGVYDQYKQPTFRVKVGDYFDRIEANSSLVKIKREFPNAIIIPDQVYISREKE